MSGVVALVDAEPTGLAEMLAGLLRSNLARDPARSRLLRPALVRVEAVDAGVGVTLRLSPRRIEVGGGATADAQLRIRASAGDLLALAGCPLRFGFPDPLTREGRAVLGRLMDGRVRVSGMVRHPALLARFARLLSVA